jgi:hypothetical protein
MVWPKRWFAVLVLMAGLCGSAGAQSWTYPGDLRTHLEQGHGVSTAGLGRFELLNLHDSLHQSEQSYLVASAKDRLHLPGRPIERTANLVSVVRPVQRAKSAVGAVVKAKPVRSTLRFIFR